MSNTDDNAEIVPTTVVRATELAHSVDPASYEAKKADMALKAGGQAFDIKEEKGAFSVYQADDESQTIKYVDAFKTHTMARRFVARRLGVGNGTE